MIHDASPVSNVDRQSPASVDPRTVEASLRARLAAVPARERVARAELHRQAALAALDLDDARAGLADARCAVRLSARCGDPELEGRCRTALVRALAFAGRLHPALCEVERAAPMLRGADLGRLELQRSVVLYKMGDHIAALDAANDALRLLPRETVDVARALNNRGIFRLYVGGFDQGLADFVAARAWYQRAGMAFAAAEVRTNLGMMLDRLGDVVGALNELDAAENDLRALDVPVHRDIVYRAEVLLGARLYDDVRAIVPAAVSALEAAGMHADAAEGRLYVAQALVLAGAREAIGEARLARVSFSRRRRWGWAALARLAEMQGRLNAGEATAAAHRDAHRTALALQRAGLAVQEREAWLMAGRFATRAGREVDAIQHWAQAARPHRSMTLSERLSAVEARARLARLRGDGTATLRACQRGLCLIEEHAAALGATDLRVSATDRGANLAHIGVGVAWQRRDPRTLFRWVERWRAAALWLAPVRPPPDERLADLLTELRSASVSARDASLDEDSSTDGADARLRVVALERAVQVASRRRTQSASFSLQRRAAPSDVQALLGDRVMVELIQNGEELGALVLADGRTTFHELGSLKPIAARAEALRFAFERLARIGDGAASEVSLRSARLHLDAMQRLVGAPLRARVAERELVVVPDLALHHMPWSWILGDGQPTSVAPSASLWHRAATVDWQCDGHVTIVAGPGLAGAETEARRIAALYEDSLLLAGTAATADAVRAALDGSRVAHIAAHGTVRRDNPLFSTIELTNGPALVHDFECISRPPTIIVLASCNSAIGQLHSSNDVVGLAAALLATGARAVVAAAVPLPDSEIVDVMVGFHSRVATGTPPAAALSEAVSNEVHDERLRLLAGGALVCYGAG